MRYAERRLPRSVQRTAAAIAMVAVIPLAGWLCIIGAASAAGVFDNEEADDVALGKWLMVVGALAVLGALVSLGGLVARLRWPTVVGAVVVAAAALVLLADWLSSGWRLGNDDSDLVAVLLGVIAVGGLALRAALSGPRAH